MLAMITGIIRHLLTAGGGALATHGYIGQDEITPLVGAALTLFGTAWSVWQKKKDKKDKKNG